jgi:hypothetical protein
MEFAPMCAKSQSLPKELTPKTVDDIFHVLDALPENNSERKAADGQRRIIEKYLDGTTYPCAF